MSAVSPRRAYDPWKAVRVTVTTVLQVETMNLRRQQKNLTEEYILVL